jgi:hypothetical protein
MGTRKKGIGRLLRMGAACAGVVILAAGLRRGGLSTGAELTEVLGFLLTMASLAWAKAVDTTLTEDEFTGQLEKQVGRKLRAEARERRLIDRDFVPLSLGPVTSERAAEQDRALAAFWSAREFQKAALELYLSTPCGQLIVVGERGSGKSVLSLMLTLAILDAKDNADEGPLPIPLPVSISSWRPSSEHFDLWFERRMIREYPVIGRAPKGSDTWGPVWDAVFSCERGCLPVLDGLDEIPASERAEAVRQLVGYFDCGAPFVLLSRHVPDLQGGFPDNAKRQISPVAAETAARYFDYLETSHGVPAAQVAAILRRAAAGSLGPLLKRPLYLDLVRSLLQERSITQAQLVNAASADGAQAPEDTLIGWSLRYRLLSVRSGGARKARYLTYLAQQMTRSETNVLPWWRLADGVSANVMIASVAILAAAPAYLLALRMPVGLTRGLAIGIVSGIAFGTLRGRPVRWRDLALTSVALPIALAVEGVCAAGLRQGLADAVEISTATVLAIGYRAVLFSPPFAQAASATNEEGQTPAPSLFTTRLSPLLRGVRTSRPWESVSVVMAIGLATTAVTAVVSAFMHFHDHQRNPLTIFMAAAFGIGIAAAAARLLIVSPDRMQPSTVLLRRGRRVGGFAVASQAGLISAVAIGLAGGISGALRFGLAYGAMMTIVFGLIVGIPVGLIGTAIRWLSAPPVEAPAEEGAKTRRRGRAPSTLRTDRAVTIAAVVGIGTAAAAVIGILTGPCHGLADAIDRQSSFIIVPADGILFGLTIGLIVACFVTAWPTYLLAHFWLVVMGRAPIRLARFLDALHQVGILRREGSYLLFRHYEFQRYLSTCSQDFLAKATPGYGKPTTAPRKNALKPLRSSARRCWQLAQGALVRMARS